MMTYERISKADGTTSPCSIEQVRRGLESAVRDIDLALENIDHGDQIGNNFFIYRSSTP